MKRSKWHLSVSNIIILLLLKCLFANCRHSAILATQNLVYNNNYYLKICYCHQKRIHLCFLFTIDHNLWLWFSSFSCKQSLQTVQTLFQLGCVIQRLQRLHCHISWWLFQGISPNTKGKAERNFI